MKDPGQRNFSIKNMSSLSLLCVSLILVYGAFTLLSEYFMTWGNIINILQYSAILGLASCGATLGVLSGSLDLSTGSIVALSTVCCAVTLEWTDDVFLSLAAGIAVGLLCGAFNGVLITVINLNPTIVTLSTMTIYKGIGNTITGGRNISVAVKEFKLLAGMKLLTVPSIIWILAVAFLAWHLILKYTTFGRAVFSVGGNENASYLSGINVKRIKYLVFTLSGMMAGIAGVMYTSLTGSASASSNGDLTLEAISAVVLGGAALSGGKGTIIGTALGVLILQGISNGLQLINMGAYLQMVVKGGVLLAAVTLDAVKSKVSEK